MSFDAHEEKIERFLREMLNLKYREIKESTFGKKNSGKSY